jgi:hypothetical protein
MEKPDKATYWRAKLKAMEKKILDARLVVLKVAVDICRRMHRTDELDELHDALKEHFNNHVTLFSENGMHAEAAKLKKQWKKIKTHLKEEAEFFNVEEHLEKLSTKLVNHHKAEKADCLIYEVGKHHFTGKEKLPGNLKWKTGDPETNNPGYDSPKKFSQLVVDYAASQDIDFPRMLDRPLISSVGAEMDNAYWSDQIMQIVIGKGGKLFNNLASTEPGNFSVIVHEWWHAITSRYAGIGLRTGYTGLDYICEGKCDAGSLNEAFSDIAAIVLGIEALKKDGLEVQISDPRVQELFKIGKGLWKKGFPDDAIRNAETGKGYADNSPVVKYVGKPVEHWYLRWDNWHDNKGVVVNWPVKNGLVKGTETVVDTHHGSACGLAVFVNHLKALGLPARTVHKIWLHAVIMLIFRTSLVAAAANTIAAAKLVEKELGMGDRVVEHLKRGWAQQKVPV